MVTPPSFTLTLDDQNVLSSDPSSPFGIVEAAFILSRFNENYFNLAHSAPTVETIFAHVTQPSTDVSPYTGGTLTPTTPESLYSTNAQMQPRRNPVHISLPPAHTLAWYLMPCDAVVLNGPRVFVPQVIYRPSRKNTVTANPQAPIVFRAEGSFDWGISLRDLLSDHPPRLSEGGSPAFTFSGPSISLKVQWPGYYPYHKRIRTRDHTAQHRPINVARLSKLVARAIVVYIHSISEQQMVMGSDSDALWRVGPFGITVEDVILVSLHQMSKGSWQPQLRLRRDPGVAVDQGGTIGF